MPDAQLAVQHHKLSEYQLARIEYHCKVATAQMCLRTEFAHNFFLMSVGRSVTSFSDMVIALSSTDEVSDAFRRLAKVQLIRKSLFGPELDETKGEDQRHFLRFSPVIQEMAWTMVEEYANPISIQLPDWPLLCYCAEAFDAIAKHYKINPEILGQFGANAMKVLPQPDG